MKTSSAKHIKKLKNSVLGIVGFLLVLFVLLLIMSPKKTAPFKDEKGATIENSIAEIIDIEINGVKQRMVIRGEDLSNPILLHIHGGPGSPDRPFLNQTDSTIEDVFTVCYWEQRGTGASYHDDIGQKSMTLDQIIKDGKSVSLYLKQRFAKDKIYIQGHSWGTVVGSHMAQKFPALFYAYIGISQIANTKLSEQLSYDFTLNQAISANNKKDIKKLESIGRPPYEGDNDWIHNTIAERKIMRPYQGKLISREQSLFDIYKAFIFHKEYSIGDKIAALKGDPFSMNQLWLTAINTNLFESIKEYKIPVYILQGKHDKTTITSVAKSYFDTIEAPVKKYHQFENSAHSPHIEEFKTYKALIKMIKKDVQK